MRVADSESGWYNDITNLHPQDVAEIIKPSGL